MVYINIYFEYPYWKMKCRVELWKYQEIIDFKFWFSDIYLILLTSK